MAEKKVHEPIFERRYQGKRNLFSSEAFQKVVKNDIDSNARTNTLKSSDKYSKMSAFASPWPIEWHNIVHLLSFTGVGGMSEATK